jgi:hypothetical protein
MDQICRSATAAANPAVETGPQSSSHRIINLSIINHQAFNHQSSSFQSSIKLSIKLSKTTRKIRDVCDSRLTRCCRSPLLSADQQQANAREKCKKRRKKKDVLVEESQVSHQKQNRIFSLLNLIMRDKIILFLSDLDRLVLHDRSSIN